MTEAGKTEQKAKAGKKRIENNQDTLKRFFGDLPIVDAKDNLRVFVNDDDIGSAVRRNPAHCVFAQACRRLYGATAVLFFRSIVYVDLPDENGKRSINKFIINLPVRKRIENWDKNGIAHPGGYLLRVPGASTSLDGMRERNKKYRANVGYKQKRKNPAYIKGHAIVVTPADTKLRAKGGGKVQMLLRKA